MKSHVSLTLLSHVFSFLHPQAESNRSHITVWTFQLHPFLSWKIILFLFCFFLSLPKFYFPIRFQSPAVSILVIFMHQAWLEPDGFSVESGVNK